MIPPRLVALGLAVALVTAGPGSQVRSVSQDAPRSGAARVTAARDPAWAPSGQHIALTILDQVWIMTRDGLGARPLVEWPDARPVVERDPVFAPDGRQIAFAADAGDGFDLFVVGTSGGAPRRLTFLPGDERWPSWAADGHLVFAARVEGQWDLHRVPSIPPTGSVGAPERLTETAVDETEPRLSPDGRLVAFVSTRDSADGGSDLWLLTLASRTATAANGRVTTSRRPPVSLVRARGDEWSPAWAPDGRRLAFGATREGVGSIWVVAIDASIDPVPDSQGVPAGGPVLVSRQGGQVAWSPDGRTLLVTDIPDPQGAYNGQPRRDRGDAAPLFDPGRAYGVRLLPAPLPPDAGETPLLSRLSLPPARLLASFDRVWDTLARLYYSSGVQASRWLALRDRHRAQAALARDAAALETVVDGLVAEQPLVREPVTTSGAVVVSAHPLASEAGAGMLERGGNVIDAAIATSFALGVVEPDASGIGGDGMALVLLAGMREPIIIDFKDQTPIHATLDNPAIFRDGRLVEDGPAAANIPGLVGGMDHLYRRFGSGKISWADLLAPAIRHADEGYVLDESLPTTLSEGQNVLARYESTRAVYQPNGKLPRAGDLFVNRAYATTLRAIATRGASDFYQGDVARQIARDMSEQGGVISYEDLAQYRAIERAPVSGRFRGHLVFSTPPPVASGTSLIEVLQILDAYPVAPGTRPASSADYLHVLIEAWKAAHPLTRIADPALWPVDVDPHLDPAHARTLFSQIDMTKASRPGRPPADRDESPESATTPAGSRLGRGTTAFAVADARGNVVVVTQTLSTWGGSFYLSKGLGFLYNNHLRLGRTRRGAYGQMLPLTRSSSTSAPTLVMREVDGVRTPLVAVGAAGNAWIVPTVFHVITQILDGGASAQAGVEGPRFLVGRDPSDPSGQSSRVQIEDRYPRALVEDLIRRGHVFQKIGRKGELRYGYASALTFDAATGQVSAGADPRRSHRAVAVR